MDINKIAEGVSLGIFKEQLLSELMENIRNDYKDVKPIIKKFWQTDTGRGGVHLHMEFEFELPKNMEEEETKYDIKDKLNDYFDSFIFNNADGEFVDVRTDIIEKINTWKIHVVYEEGKD